MVQGVGVMPERVPFIEDTPSLLRDKCCAALNCRSECTPWGAFDFERYERKADLSVAVAGPQHSAVTDRFHWIDENPIGAPTLASSLRTTISLRWR